MFQKNQCRIYSKYAKRFRKQIQNGFSKSMAGVYYKNGLRHSCKKQCINYRTEKDSKDTRYYICLVCDSKFTSLALLDKHQNKEHLEICKWYLKYYNVNEPKSKHLTLGDFLK